MEGSKSSFLNQKAFKQRKSTTTDNNNTWKLFFKENLFHSSDIFSKGMKVIKL